MVIEADRSAGALLDLLPVTTRDTQPHILVFATFSSSE